ncbi:hypothetical protein ACJMK2_041744 [Sinanodonta woodiana]|uniref:Uncharacterized protein n=1 Tax=Sinanodonta woodiana TaxID=1069815 RepID=A0ABD3W583_SINWO
MVIWYVFLACVLYGSECMFPMQWRGTWYQSRTIIDISINSISRKGTCLQKDGNRFLMLNNVSEPCPFQGSYTFTYANATMTNLQCTHPVSDIRACADESKFKFIFKHCPGVPGTHDQVLDFQCLATWVNGEKFMYGLFTEPWMTQDEYRYRCFMHSFYGSSGDMSMSADATCQGLQNPTLGAVSMSFSRVSWPRSTCTFPRYLANQNKWRDLSGRIRLEVESGLQVLRLKERLPLGTMMYKDGSAVAVSKLVLRCVQSVGESISGLIADFFIYYTNDSCVSGYQCLRIIKRDENVIELYVGDSLNSTDANCDSRQFEMSTKYVMIPDVNTSVACSASQKGIYQYMDKASDCTGMVDIGCTHADEIVIETICPLIKKSVSILQCLQSWRLDGKAFLITQQPGQQDSPAMCLTLIETEFGMEVQADNYCEGDRWTVKKKFLNYLLYTPPDGCPLKRDIQSDQSIESDRLQNEGKAKGHTGFAIQWDANIGVILACAMTVYCVIVHR